MLDALTQVVVTPKAGLWRRLAAQPLFSYYHRLFALVMLANALVVWLGPGVQAMGVISPPTVSSTVEAAWAAGRLASQVSVRAGNSRAFMVCS